MTTEQLAIVVPASVAVLALAINALLHVKINRQTLDAQRRLAVQERVRTTYEDMLHMVTFVMEYVDEHEPSRHAQPEPPQAPDADHVRTVRARIGTHGSREVKAILARWEKQYWRFSEAFEKCQSALRGEQSSTKDDSIGDLWKKFESSRKEFHGIVRELEDAVSNEMRA